MPSVAFKFTLQLADFTWFEKPDENQPPAAQRTSAERSAPKVATEQRVDFGAEQVMMANKLVGDARPLCHKVVCWMHSAGMTNFAGAYDGKCEVTYAPQKSDANTDGAMLDKDGKFPDTLKIALFTEHPKSTEMVHANNPTYVNSYRGAEPIYALLCCGHVDVRALRQCMRDDGPTAQLPVQFVHNYSNARSTVILSNATVTLNGTEHTQAATWADDAALHPVFFRSYMHDVIARSQTNIMNSKVVGQAIASVASVRPNSIGGMQQCPITMSPMMNEVFRIADMKAYLASDHGAVCAEHAAHCAVHAFAVAGIQPFVERQTVPGMHDARRLSEDELLQAVHGALTLPWVSNETTPYVSDMTAWPSAAMKRALMMGADVPVLGADSFQDSEMFSLYPCQPNGVTYADDCEGGTRYYCYNFDCLQHVHTAALEALREFAVSRNPEVLATWADTHCHAELPCSQLLAYATQMTVVGIVARTAVSVHALTIGAQSATPLQKMDSSFVGTEGGHSAAAARFDHTQMMASARSVYAYVDNMLAVPHSSVASIPSLDVKIIAQQESQVTNPTHAAVYNALFSTQQCAGAAGARPELRDLATENTSFQLLESTTCVSRCPLRGHLRVSSVPGSSPALAHFQASIKANGAIRLSVGEFLQLRGINLVSNLVRDPVNVRVTGFVNDLDTQMGLPTFYKSVYMLDEFATMQLETPASLPGAAIATGAAANCYRVGCDAADFLFHRDRAMLTMEPIGYPLMAQANVDQFRDGWMRQIAESRLPSVGADAMLCDLRTRVRAGPVTAHFPEKPDAGLRRVTIACSGPEGTAVWEAYQNNAAFRASLLEANDFVHSTQVFRVARETTVIAQTVNVDALMQLAARKAGGAGEEVGVGADAGGAAG